MATHTSRPARLPRGAGRQTCSILAAVLVGFALFSAPQQGMTQSGPNRDLDPPAGSSTASRPVYKPTPAREVAVRRFVADVLVFTALHEMGHMMIQETKQKHLGQEEAMADSFAAAVLTFGSRGADDNNPLAAAAKFWYQAHLNQQVGNQGQYNWADIHGQPAQRAYQAVCVLYVSSPQRWVTLARSLGFDEDGLGRCSKEAAQNKHDWDAIVAENHIGGFLAPVFAPYVAVFLYKIDSTLPIDVRAYLSHGRQLIEDSKVLNSVGRSIKQLNVVRHAAIHQKAIPGVNTESLQRDIQHPESEESGCVRFQCNWR